MYALGNSSTWQPAMQKAYTMNNSNNGHNFLAPEQETLSGINKGSLYRQRGVTANN